MYTPVRSEVMIGDAESFEKEAAKLRDPSSNDCPTVDHGTLLANEETCIATDQNGYTTYLIQNAYYVPPATLKSTPTALEINVVTLVT